MSNKLDINLIPHWGTIHKVPNNKNSAPYSGCMILDGIDANICTIHQYQSQCNGGWTPTLLSPFSILYWGIINPNQWCNHLTSQCSV